MVKERFRNAWPGSIGFKKGKIRFETRYSLVVGYTANALGYLISEKARTLNQLQRKLEIATNNYFEEGYEPQAIELWLLPQEGPVFKRYFVIFEVCLFSSVAMWLFWQQQFQWSKWGYLLFDALITAVTISIELFWIGIVIAILVMILGVVWAIFRDLFESKMLLKMEKNGFCAIGDVNFIITFDGKFEVDKYQFRCTFINHQAKKQDVWFSTNGSKAIPANVKIFYFLWLPKYILVQF